jgi:xanthine/uracil permease
VGFSGIGLGAILGIVLNLVLPKGHHEESPLDEYVDMPDDLE